MAGADGFSVTTELDFRTIGRDALVIVGVKFCGCVDVTDRLDSAGMPSQFDPPTWPDEQHLTDERPPTARPKSRREATVANHRRKFAPQEILDRGLGWKKRPH
jgi:hypothetical protein